MLMSFHDTLLLNIGSQLLEVVIMIDFFVLTDSIRSMNEKLKKEIYDLEGEIEHHHLVNQRTKSIYGSQASVRSGPRWQQPSLSSRLSQNPISLTWILWLIKSIRFIVYQRLWWILVTIRILVTRWCLHHWESTRQHYRNTPSVSRKQE